MIFLNQSQRTVKKPLSAGIDFCLKQSRELLQGGAPGLHFYTLNKIHPVDVIIKETAIK